MRFSEPHLSEIGRHALEGSKNVIFIVDSSLRITYCNPAWDKFALANGGEDVVATRVLGSDLMSVIPEPLLEFYDKTFQRCRNLRIPFDLDYDCSSAELYRVFHLRILPLDRYAGLMFVNSLKVEHAHELDRLPSRPTDTYFGAGGMLKMCSYCRRTQRQDALDVWDWVPGFLQKREWKISWSVCPECVSYLYFIR